MQSEAVAVILGSSGHCQETVLGMVWCVGCACVVVQGQSDLGLVASNSGNDQMLSQARSPFEATGDRVRLRQGQWPEYYVTHAVLYVNEKELVLLWCICGYVKWTARLRLTSSPPCNNNVKLLYSTCLC